MNRLAITAWVLCVLFQGLEPTVAARGQGGSTGATPDLGGMMDKLKECLEQILKQFPALKQEAMKAFGGMGSSKKEGFGLDLSKASGLLQEVMKSPSCMEVAMSAKNMMGKGFGGNSMMKKMMG